MPRRGERRKRADYLVRQYLKYLRMCLRIERKRQRLSGRMGISTMDVDDSPERSLSPLSDISSVHLSSNSETDLLDSESEDQSGSEDSESSDTSDTGDMSTSSEESSASLDSDSTSSGTGSSSEWDSSDDLSMSDSDHDSSSAFSTPPRVAVGRSIVHEISDMYSHRYQAPRNNLPRPPGQLLHLLTVLKPHRPDKFREVMRVTPFTFDKLLREIAPDPVFANHSQNDQMEISHQLAIALFRFGHSGNAASLQKVANWSGYSKGTVNLATRRVMTALLRPEFRKKCVRLPTPAEKEKAKQWVEAHSCKEWRDGYCMVDGTLVPLYARPYFFGQSYFDRKCNYSLNIQVVNTPDLRIIDFGYGFTGSTHDSMAWEGTNFYRAPHQYLQGNEFLWADSAYPIQTWLVAPYKLPERNQPDNETFNTHLSYVRIRCEHAIGFLKGRFQSLRGLRVNIINEATHKFALYWITCSINVHAFAMECEAEERGYGMGSNDFDDDPFIAAGCSSSSDWDESADPEAEVRRVGGPRNLRAAKERREELKKKLFLARERRRQARGDDSDDEFEV